ncbi:hypothetical protein HDV05_003975 [Chytridiales sp. JEL 0842]|nr:hypothetical protein HDV05_003975 [Chytridiales sp. JEL 0842]
MNYRGSSNSGGSNIFPPSKPTSQMGATPSAPSMIKGPSHGYPSSAPIMMKGSSQQGYAGPPASDKPAFGGPPAGAAQQQFFGAQFLNDFQGAAATQLGVQFGNQALQQGQKMVNQNIGRFINMHQLKYYFNVSNSYVLNKIRLLIFPFRHKSWTRLVRRSEQDGQMEGYKPPREDLNAPDMYLPAMAFVTYVLLVGMLFGYRKSFTPDALGITSTTALFIVACEVLFFKLGCYLLNVQSEVSFLDLIAYCGYKFVPLIGIMLLKFFVTSKWPIYLAFGYVVAAFGFFTVTANT